MMVPCPCVGSQEVGSGGGGYEEDATLMVRAEEEPVEEVTPVDLCFQVKNEEDGDQGRKMDFVIFPTYRGVEDKVDGILDHGGTVREFSEEEYQREPRQDYSITLINFKEICYNRAYSTALLPNDAYDIQFITDFIGNPTETDLRQYKITPTNHKLKGQNVNDILFQRRSWNSLVRLRTSPPRVNNANLLKLYYAIQNHNYDTCSSAESQGSQDPPSPGQIPEPQRNGRGSLENRESPRPPSPLPLRSSPRKKKNAVEAVQDGEVTSNDIHFDMDLNIDVDVEGGPPAPEPENREANKEQPDREKKKRMEFYSQEFIPPKDKRNRVIRNGRRNKVVAPINTWLGGDDSNDEDDGDRVQKNNGSAISPARRSSPRKSNNAGAGATDQAQNEPVAGHSRARADERVDSDINIEDSSSSDDDGDRVTSMAPPMVRPKPAQNRISLNKNNGPASPGLRRSSPRRSNNAGTNDQAQNQPVAGHSRAGAGEPFDSDINIEDSSSSSDDDDFVERRRSQQQRGRVQRPAVIDRGGGRRWANHQGSGYNPTDGQHMVNLVIRNNWGRYIKGDGLWRYVEEHKLLQHRVGARSRQGLCNYFKNRVHPKLMSMTVGGTHPYVISNEDLAKYKKARKEAELNPHGNPFPKEYDVNNVVRV